MATRKNKIEIGHGRSKCIYIEPVATDTAVVLAFFNPAGFHRILRNMMYIIQCLKENNIPYFLIECVFNGAAQQIPEATMVVNSNSYMFYKEQLINKLEPVIPEQYTKLVCMDGDILFDSPDWVDQISNKLNRVDIIQPYNQACWLTPDNTRIRYQKPSYAVGIMQKKIGPIRTLNMFHPGFVWAFKRETFRRLGGFFSNAIIGNGDILFVFNFFKDEVPEEWVNAVLRTRFLLDKWSEYHENFKKVKPTIGFLPNKALHLFHGLPQNRQYNTRYQSVSHMLTGKWDDQVFINSDGIFEFKNPKLSEGVLDYFKRRDEDIPLEKAERIVANSRNRQNRRRTRRMYFRKI